MMGSADGAPAGPRITTDIPAGAIRECVQKTLKQSARMLSLKDAAADGDKSDFHEALLAHAEIQAFQVECRLPAHGKQADRSDEKSAGAVNSCETAEELGINRHEYVSQLRERHLKSVFWCDATSKFHMTAVGMKTRQLQKSECIALLGREMTSWCVNHPGKELTPSTAQRWGYGDLVSEFLKKYHCYSGKGSGRTSSTHPWPLYSSKGLERNARQGRKWVVERVLMGNGQADNSGIRLEENVMYGSYTIHGGHEAFFPILFYTLSIRRLVPDGNLPFQYVEYKEGSGPQFEIRSQSRVEALDAVMSHCLKHPGKPLIIGGPGSRGSIPDLRKYRTKKNGRLFLASSEGECIHASVINGIHRIHGAHVAREALGRARPVFLKGLGGASEWLKTLKVRTVLCKLAQHERRKLWENPYRWIAAQKQGLFVVRLSGNPKVDHTITVDANAGVILDCELRYPLVLSEEALLLCRGSYGENVRIGEVRKFLKEELGKRTRNN